MFFQRKSIYRRFVVDSLRYYSFTDITIILCLNEPHGRPLVCGWMNEVLSNIYTSVFPTCLARIEIIMLHLDLVEVTLDLSL